MGEVFRGLPATRSDLRLKKPPSPHRREGAGELAPWLYSVSFLWSPVGAPLD